jgi:hypothetical protein
MKRKMIAIVGLFLITVFTPGAGALAQDSAKVLVTILHASNDGHDFNLENDAYRDQLIKLFSYTHYQQIGQRYAFMERSEPQTVMLPGGYEMILTSQGEENGRLSFGVLIRKEGKQYVRTSLSSLKNGVVFLGGPPYEKGVMIIVLEMGF